MLDKFFASVVEESVVRTYATYSEEEAEWDSLFGVAWVAGRFEKILMLVRGSTRDSVRKAREAHLINKAKTLHPLGINRHDTADLY